MPKSEPELPDHITIAVKSKHGKNAQPYSLSKGLLARAIQDAFGWKYIDALCTGEVLVYADAIRDRKGRIKASQQNVAPAILAVYHPGRPTQSLYSTIQRYFEEHELIIEGEFPLFRIDRRNEG